MKKAITLFALLAIVAVSTSVSTVKINTKSTVTADSDTGGRENGTVRPRPEL